MKLGKTMWTQSREVCNDTGIQRAVHTDKKKSENWAENYRCMWWIISYKAVKFVTWVCFLNINQKKLEHIWGYALDMLSLK